MRRLLVLLASCVVISKRRVAHHLNRFESERRARSPMPEAAYSSRYQRKATRRSTNTSRTT